MAFHGLGYAQHEWHASGQPLGSPTEFSLLSLIFCVVADNDSEYFARDVDVKVLYNVAV